MRAAKPMGHVTDKWLKATDESKYTEAVFVPG